jgi:RimJ/RimL family protein N-acetyltransferase
MPVSLHALTVAELEAIADSRAPEGRFANVAVDAIVPAVVAARALPLQRTIRDGQLCGTFYLVRDADGDVVGSCGFKGAPVNRRVEIGYGVSPSHRKRGYATRAVRELLARAFASGLVDEVLAEVNAANEASTRVVGKLGFRSFGTRVDADGEPLVQWVAVRAG